MRAIVAPLALCCALNAGATPDRGANCAACHTDAFKNGMALANFQGTTNLGAGLLKVFQVRPGSTAAIQLNVTNGYGGNYGLTINNLGSGGFSNAAHHLVFTPDPTWTSRSSGTYFTVGPTGISPDLWTFNLLVQTNTPLDFYTVQAQMAGFDSGALLWSQQESFYVQVMAATAPRPLIVAPHRVGSSFSVQVATTSGFTYYLEYKSALSAASWVTAAQTAGDGTVKTLNDTTATDPQRFYRVRVQ
jgi:hypothetical protein